MISQQKQQQQRKEKLYKNKINNTYNNNIQSK